MMKESAAPASPGSSYLATAVLFLLIFWIAPDIVLAADPAGVGQVNLTLAQYQKVSQEMQAREYRPACLSVYRVKAETLYSVLWQRGGQIPWKETLNRSQKEFESDAKTMQDDEFRPISLQCLVVDGQPRYFVIWKKLDGEFYYFRDRLTAETFRKYSADYAQREIYPTSITACEIRGQLLFAGIWEKTRPGSVKFELSLNETSLTQKTKEHSKNGFHPQFVSGYMSRGRPSWVAIWSQQQNVDVQAPVTLSETDWKKRTAEMEASGYDLMSLQGAILTGKPRFAAVWRKFVIVEDP